MRKQSIIILTLLCLLGSLGAMAQTPKYELINNPSYPMHDIGVATLNARDYGIDNTGQTDCTAKVQQLLDYLDNHGNTANYSRGRYSNQSGGVLYMPAGTYRFDGRLFIPRGVTIRGDWKQPVKGQPVSGTIFKIMGTSQTGAGTDTESNAFITMQPATLVEGITFWYPDNSDIGNIRQYPPTIRYGQDQYWGNEYCNTRHCTFINSYTAIKFNSTNGGGCPNIFDVYGTPLHEGVVIDRIADVGRFDGLSFSPAYWAGSGLAGAPSEGAIRSYLKQNATGFIMRRNDWSYTCNYECDGYHVGFSCQKTVANENSTPNGHNYNFTLTDCETGVDIQAASYPGIMFTRVNTTGCTTGVSVNDGVEGTSYFYECALGGSIDAVTTAKNASVPVHLTKCTLSGNVDIYGGELNSIDCTYKNNVFISAKARTIFTGNTVAGTFTNKSVFECKVSDATVALPTLPEFKDEWMAIKDTKPAKTALYVVTDYGATPVSYDNYNNMTDCSAAIQSALNAAGQNGGGIVYLPAGRYRMNSPITIPDGVELKGASDLANVPHGQGAIFEVYAGEGNENGTPFITMGKKSGLRGVTIDYPDQTDPSNPKKFPYSVRGNEGVYIVNLALRTAYRGVDLFTNNCTGHYVDYIGGHCFMNVIRLGGNATGGIISNIQCNTIAYASGSETKFGAWHNSQGINNGLCYGQNVEDLDFFIIGDCDNEVLYNNFLYGCRKGMWFVSDGQGGAANVHSLGNAVDGAVQTFYFDATRDDLNLINSQVVALNHDANIIKGATDACFLTLGAGMQHAVNLFSGCHWGSGKYFAKVNGGTLTLIDNNLVQSGTTSSFDIASGAKLNMIGSEVHKSYAFAPNNSEPRMSIQASILDATGANQGSMSLYQNNLPLAWNFIDKSVVEDRTGWTATASTDADHPGEANNAIDGNEASRWTTHAAQTAGQWFSVDFGSERTFNAVILDDNQSSGDQPKTYSLQIWKDGQWQTIKEGNGGGAYMVLSLDEPVTTSKIRITQNSNTTGGWWSIHEIYIASLTMENETQEVTGFDLVADGLNWTPASKTFAAGTKVTGLQAKVTNNADVALPAGTAVTVGVSIDGKQVGTTTFSDGLAAQESRLIDIPGSYTAEAGGHTAVLTIASVKGEASTDNNSRQRTFNATGTATKGITEWVNPAANNTSTGIDLVITRVTWKNAGPMKAGDPITFIAYVKNIGDTEAPANVKKGIQFQVNNSTSNIRWCDTHYEAIAPGQEIELECNSGSSQTPIWTAADNTPFTAWINDTHNVTPENEANNKFQFTVKLADTQSSEPSYLDNPTGPDNVVIADDVVLTVSASGYATLYYSDRALTIPSDVQAFTYSVAAGKLQATEVTGVIPAGEPVVVKAAQGSYTFTVSNETRSLDNSNMLHGTDTETAITNDATYYYYMVSYDGNGKNVGFYWGNATGSAFTNGAHRAYLMVPKTTAQGAKGWAFDGVINGINGIDSAVRIPHSAAYNLQGQRVGKNYHGIVIVNGKKVIK